jgi:hypothetical protein
MREKKTRKAEVYEHPVPAHAREPEVIVIRERLHMFPPVGEEFTVLAGDRNCTSKIVARSCQCAGPDSPHEHYYLDLTEVGKVLDWGTFSRVRIRRLSANRFSLVTRK